MYATPPPPRRRSSLPLIIAVVVGVLAIAATYLILRPSGDDETATPDRSGCVPLSIAASSEKAALLEELARAYDRADRRFDGRCAQVTVLPKASGAAMEALATGWDAQREGAPLPQVWSPASSSWIGLLRQRLTAADKGSMLADGPVPSLAQTPLVLAMPKPMAEALGWPDKAIGWSDVLGLANNPQGWGAAGHPEWGQFRLGKTHPRYSTSGLHATIGAYIAATGRSGDLTEADLDDPKVTGFAKGVESSVVHYGDTTLTFLANLADADARGQGMAYISAVAVEEKSVVDYNQGNPTGDPALAGKGRKPQVPLAAVYPAEGTLLSDNPYAVLAAASDEQNAAAADFLAYVQGAQAQQRFTDAGFRTFDGKAGQIINQGNGLLPDRRLTVLDPPASPVLAKALTSWDAQRKRAKVLLVLDVSGSMQELTAGGRSKLELAKQAVLQSLDLFAPDDEVGLWTFSTEAAGATTPYRENVPVGLNSANRDRIRQVVGALTATGGTALYATARAAQQQLLRSVDPDRINAVVLLTDGKNEYPRDNDLEGLIRDLDTSDLENSVRLFTIAYGDKADLGTLSRMSKASRAAAYDARDPATIDRVLLNVLSNF